MNPVLQFGKPASYVEIDPDLKEFIDRVIVPTLVKGYLAELDEASTQNGDSRMHEILRLGSKNLASSDDPVAESQSRISGTGAPAPGQRDVRP
jgi:hypothetical protein